MYIFRRRGMGLWRGREGKEGGGGTGEVLKSHIDISTRSPTRWSRHKSPMRKMLDCLTRDKVAEKNTTTTAQ